MTEMIIARDALTALRNVGLSMDDACEALRLFVINHRVTTWGRVTRYEDREKRSGVELSTTLQQIPTHELSYFKGVHYDEEGRGSRDEGDDLLALIDWNAGGYTIREKLEFAGPIIDGIDFETLLGYCPKPNLWVVRVDGLRFDRAELMSEVDRLQHLLRSAQAQELNVEDIYQWLRENVDQLVLNSKTVWPAFSAAMGSAYVKWTTFESVRKKYWKDTGRTRGRPRKG